MHAAVLAYSERLSAHVVVWQTHLARCKYGSFVGDLPTLRFYPEWTGRSTSSGRCLPRGGRRLCSKRSLFDAPRLSHVFIETLGHFVPVLNRGCDPLPAIADAVPRDANCSY